MFHGHRIMTTSSCQRVSRSLSAIINIIFIRQSHTYGRSSGDWYILMPNFILSWRGVSRSAGRSSGTPNYYCFLCCLKYRRLPFCRPFCRHFLAADSSQGINFNVSEIFAFMPASGLYHLSSEVSSRFGLQAGNYFRHAPDGMR